ncbi:DUF6745 domain-containing protein [Rhodospirillum centenum]|uniref:DUF6745 domain-containing protein n=1 Tax=Rhodospirillum centenum (strain ATCC 51521 / SW) TaxID=414684 RepID=B6IS05_RHOCS|nr:hypothetical protein [Rhodospirillum centenum]ACI98241.1 hypothetical protein RC1_0810 [Rhodospirillum centenum SW]
MSDAQNRQEALADWKRRFTWQVPLDRDAAERAIADAYCVSGLRPPERIVWAQGPRDAQAILARIGWRRWWPWGLVAAALLLPLTLSTLPSLPAEREALLSGVPAVVLVLSISALWAHTILLLGTPGPRAAADWKMRALPVVALVVALAALAFYNQGDGVPLSWFLAGFIALPGVVALAMRPPRPSVTVSTRSGRTVRPKLGRAFQHALSEGGARPRSWFPLGEAGERLPDHVRLMAMAAPPSFAAPVIYHALDRLLRNHVAGQEEAGGAGRPRDRLTAFSTLVRHVDCVWAFEHLAVALEPPVEVHLDERGRFHRMDGPAVVWRDGCGLFAVEGRFASDTAILFAPETLSLAQIRDEPDPGVRRALLAQYGPERVMEQAGHMVCRDSYGELWRAEQFDGEPLTMVRVINSTPEPDGSHKVYWLRVPPHTRYPREGVAWTFGLAPAFYAPSVET